MHRHRHEKRSLLRQLHDYFLPHRGNGYKPHLFRTASVASLVLAVLLLEGAYLADIHLVFPKTNFLASVLPGTLIALTNDDRATVDAPPVSEDATLDKAATLAAEDMAAKGYFAHVSPEGKTPWDWLGQAGYDYTYAGENLAVNFDDSSAVENAWMASPSHHANIVKPQYTEVGIGVASGMYEGKQATFVVQFFATPAAAKVAETPAKPVATPKPASVITAEPATTTVIAPTTVAIATTAPAQDAGAVLGTEAATPSPAPSFFAQVAASPTHTIVVILSVLAGIVLIFFIIAVSAKMQVQYLEVIGGGLALIVLLLGLIVFNIHSAARVEVPNGGAAATTAT